MCIYCENKGTKDFKTPEAVKKHMIDKGHCFMNTEQFEEYAAFYDFSKPVTRNGKIAEEVLSVSGEEDSDWESIGDSEEDEEEEKKSC